MRMYWPQLPNFYSWHRVTSNRVVNDFRTKHPDEKMCKTVELFMYLQ